MDQCVSTFNYFQTLCLEREYVVDTYEYHRLCLVMIATTGEVLGNVYSLF